jgi:hypothetical protein
LLNVKQQIFHVNSEREQIQQYRTSKGMTDILDGRGNDFDCH